MCCETCQYCGVPLYSNRYRRDAKYCCRKHKEAAHRKHKATNCLKTSQAKTKVEARTTDIRGKFNNPPTGETQQSPLWGDSISGGITGGTSKTLFCIINHSVNLVKILRKLLFFE